MWALSIKSGDSRGASLIFDRAWRALSMSGDKRAVDQTNTEDAASASGWAFFIAREEMSQQPDQDGAGANRNEMKPWIIRFFSETKATDWAIAFLTLGLLIVGYWQWTAIYGQLGEMKAAGAQTDQLISLYREQVNKLGQQTEKLGQQVSKLGDEVEQTHALVDQAIISNANTVDALHKSERPWITVESFEIVPPVTMPTERAPMMSMGFKYRIINTGKSVATDGWSLVFLEPNAPNQLAKEWLHGCDEVARI